MTPPLLKFCPVFSPPYNQMLLLQALCPPHFPCLCPHHIVVCLAQTPPAVMFLKFSCKKILSLQPDKSSQSKALVRWEWSGVVLLYLLWILQSTKPGPGNTGGHYVSCFWWSIVRYCPEQLMTRCWELKKVCVPGPWDIRPLIHHQTWHQS